MTVQYIIFFYSLMYSLQLQLQNTFVHKGWIVMLFRLASVFCCHSAEWLLYPEKQVRRQSLCSGGVSLHAQTQASGLNVLTEPDRGKVKSHTCWSNTSFSASCWVCTKTHTQISLYVTVTVRRFESLLHKNEHALNYLCISFKNHVVLYGNFDSSAQVGQKRADKLRLYWLAWSWVTRNMDVRDKPQCKGLNIRPTFPSHSMQTCSCRYIFSTTM